MSFIQTTIGLLVSPKHQFEIIRNEKNTYFGLVKDFLIYVILINSFIDTANILLVGPYTGRSTSGSIIFAIAFNLMEIFFVYISGVIIDFFAPIFSCKKNRMSGLQLATFCSVNTIIGSLLAFIPVSNIGLLSLIFLVYIRFYGLKILYNSQKKTIIYALFPELLLLIPFALLMVTGSILQSILSV